MRKVPLSLAALITGLLLTGSHLGRAQDSYQDQRAQLKLPKLFPFPNNAGVLQTYSTSSTGTIDLSNPFFQPFSTNGNGRSCFTCHRPDQGWGISAERTKILYDLTNGSDPLFRTVDASNCGTAIDTSTVEGRRQAYSLVRDRAVVRTSLAVPTSLKAGGTAEFEVTNISNPYATSGDNFCGHADTASAVGGDLQLYRRPIPTTNLLFISAVQWDGRDSAPPRGNRITFATYPGDLMGDLNGTTVSATSKRLEDSILLTDPRVQQVTDFELSIFTAQAIDHKAGALTADGALGGPQAIASTFLPQFYIGINDPFPGGNPQGTPFTTTIFTLYDSWANPTSHIRAREQVLRGQQVFNNTVINVTGVAGINDVLGVTVFKGACGTCHDTPGLGDHSVAAPLNIGIADPPETNVLDSSYLPVYTLQNVNAMSPQFGQQVRTTDPGRALISGLWADIGKFKGPILRGLASRAPYFHNGLARSLDDVVDFYNGRFKIGLSGQQHDDLVAFLKTL
jgi:cytochrome c peroxidase